MSLLKMRDGRFTARCGGKSAHGSMHSMMWAPYDIGMCVQSEDDFTEPAEKVEKTRHVLLKFAIGLANDNRRRVRISAWMNLTVDDAENAKHLGMPIDEDNECELTLGQIGRAHV